MTLGPSTADGPGDPGHPPGRSIGVMQAAARRRLVVFVVGIMVAGMAGRLIDGSEVDTAAPGLGQALWLVAPLLFGVGLSRLGPDRRSWGLRPRVVAAWPWYVVAVLFFPLVTLVLVVVGVGSGSLKAAALSLHLVVGVVWGLWHLPYIDAFMALYHDDALPALAVPLFLLGVIPTAVVYGEIRLRSGTVWTAVVLHTLANAATNPLFTEDLLAVVPERAWLVGPAVDNLGYIVVVGLAASAVARLRPWTGSRGPDRIVGVVETGRRGGS